MSGERGRVQRQPAPLTGPVPLSTDRAASAQGGPSVDADYPVIGAQGNASRAFRAASLGAADAIQRGGAAASLSQASVQKREASERVGQTAASGNSPPIEFETLVDLTNTALDLAESDIGALAASLAVLEEFIERQCGLDQEVVDAKSDVKNAMKDYEESQKPTIWSIVGVIVDFGSSVASIIDYGRSALAAARSSKKAERAIAASLSGEQHLGKPEASSTVGDMRSAKRTAKLSGAQAVGSGKDLVTTTAEADQMPSASDASDDAVSGMVQATNDVTAKVDAKVDSLATLVEQSMSTELFHHFRAARAQMAMATKTIARIVEFIDDKLAERYLAVARAFEAAAKLMDTRLHALQKRMSARQSGGGAALAPGSRTRSLFDRLANDPEARSRVRIMTRDRNVADVRGTDNPPLMQEIQASYLVCDDLPLHDELREIASDWTAGPKTDLDVVQGIPISVEMRKALGALSLPLEHGAAVGVRVVGRAREQVISLEQWEDDQYRESLIGALNRLPVERTTLP